ncbi:MAG: tRNA (N6-threonylcarbamoyladenosine(37)-N6)-methyltransferase TrmO [Bacteroidaceae bacterium]|nr:tRNA (N6-threonylcarbamoyladenosine(37)-N6)-methyltransferase TrmO [Bacteroidaceae bacterium]
MIQIAHIETDFPTKFGVPRQSGLVPTVGRVVFEPEYRNREAVRGLDGFSHIWLLWIFSEAVRSDGAWSPTVRPPRLGGNRRMGVWATRSPFRPNNIGLSSVRILKIETDTPDGPAIWVEGADLMNGTPIVDIKPYLPFSDSHPDARAGFAAQTYEHAPLKVVLPSSLSEVFSEKQLETLRKVLEADPRPHYQNDSERVYGMEYAGTEIRFRVDGNTLTVIE